jgi:hypothetical protein
MGRGGGRSTPSTPATPSLDRTRQTAGAAGPRTGTRTAPMQARKEACTPKQVSLMRGTTWSGMEDAEARSSSHAWRVGCRGFIGAKSPFPQQVVTGVVNAGDAVLNTVSVRPNSRNAVLEGLDRDTTTNGSAHEVTRMAHVSPGLGRHRAPGTRGRAPCPAQPRLACTKRGGGVQLTPSTLPPPSPPTRTHTTARPSPGTHRTATSCPWTAGLHTQSTGARTGSGTRRLPAWPSLALRRHWGRGLPFKGTPGAKPRREAAGVGGSERGLRNALKRVQWLATA